MYPFSQSLFVVVVVVVVVVVRSGETGEKIVIKRGQLKSIFFASKGANINKKGGDDDDDEGR